MPSAIFCILFPLISRIHSSLFFGTGGVLSLFNFSRQVSSISTKELVLPCHGRCILFRLCCNGHSLLLSSYLSRIGRIENPPAAPVELVPGHFSSHSSLSSYRLFAPLTLWRLSVSLRPLVQALGSCPASGGSKVFRHAPIPRKGSGSNNNSSLPFVVTQS